MTPYKIKIERKALKALQKIHPTHRDRLKVAIDALADDPRPPGVKKLKGTDDTWRIRVGSYRVLYDVLDDELIVFVIHVAHRKDAY